VAPALFSVLDFAGSVEQCYENKRLNLDVVLVFRNQCALLFEIEYFRDYCLFMNDSMSTNISKVVID